MSLTLVLHRFRWLHLPASLLTLILQRAPLLKSMLTAEASLGSPVVMLLRSAFTVAAAGAYHAVAGATTLTTNPATPATATVGQSFSMVFAVTGAPTPALSYEVSGSIPPGLTIPGLNGDLLNASNGTLTGTPTTAGSYTMNVRAWDRVNKQGEGGSPTFQIRVTVSGSTPAVPAPTIVRGPRSITVAAGAGAVLGVEATGDGTLSYQWRKDGTAITGATARLLVLSGVAASQAGNYTVSVTNSGGTITSSAATLTVDASASAGTARLINLSILQNLSDGQGMTAGITVDKGSGARTLLIRAIGPGLQAELGQSPVLPDPKLILRRGDTVLAENDNWGGETALDNACAAAGAFRITSGTSKDAMLLVTLPAGGYTAEIPGASGASGKVIVEVYELP